MFCAGSIHLICVPFGCFVSGLITQPLGRKKSMMLLNIPFFTVWLLLYNATSVTTLYIALVISGLAGGLHEAPVIFLFAFSYRDVNLFHFLCAFGIFIDFFRIFVSYRVFEESSTARKSANWRCKCDMCMCLPILGLEGAGSLD